MSRAGVHHHFIALRISLLQRGACRFSYHAAPPTDPHPGTRVKAYVAVTDRDWFEFLSRQPGIDVGGGFFASFSKLPVSMVWEHHPAGSVLPAARAVFESWIPAPADFAKSVVQGKSYDLAQPVGRDLWSKVMLARAGAPRAVSENPVEVEGLMFGEAQLGRVRFKQGAFRVMVTVAYSRRCAISGEKALPVLQAAHIVPVAEGGLHRMDNGVLPWILRAACLRSTTAFWPTRWPQTDISQHRVLNHWQRRLDSTGANTLPGTRRSYRERCPRCVLQTIVSKWTFDAGFGRWD